MEIWTGIFWKVHWTMRTVKVNGQTNRRIMKIETDRKTSYQKVGRCFWPRHSKDKFLLSCDAAQVHLKSMK
uniref:Ribosomal protein L31 n=1 Tax=Panagrolaimus sp. JU765 TaxID=591449 RepID=A0AC34QIC8_9BILA